MSVDLAAAAAPSTSWLLELADRRWCPEPDPEEEALDEALDEAFDEAFDAEDEVDAFRCLLCSSDEVVVSSRPVSSS